MPVAFQVQRRNPSIFEEKSPRIYNRLQKEINLELKQWKMIYIYIYI